MNYYAGMTAEDIWAETWPALALFSLDSIYGEEIAECQASVLRTRRYAHIDRGPYDAAMARMHDVDRRYTLDVLAMFDLSSGRDRKARPRDGEGAA